MAPSNSLEAVFARSTTCLFPASRSIRIRRADSARRPNGSGSRRGTRLGVASHWLTERQFFGGDGRRSRRNWHWLSFRFNWNSKSFRIPY